MADDKSLLNSKFWRMCVDEFIEHKLELQHIENGEKDYRYILADTLPARWGGYNVINNNARLRLFEWLKQNDIHQPEKRDIRMYFRYLKDHRASIATIRKVFYIACDFFRFLDGEGIYSNSVKDLEPYKVKGENIHKREYVSVELFQKLVNSIDVASVKGARDKAIITLAYMRGLRIGSIVRLQFKDFVYNMTDNYYQIFVTVKKMRNEPETMRIPKPAGEAIQKYLNMLQVEGVELKAHHPLFVSFKPGCKIKAITVSSVSHIVKSYFRALADRGIIDTSQLTFLTAHSLRHGFVSALRQQLGQTETMNLSGHKAVATMKRYDHTIQRKVLEHQIDNLFSSVVKKNLKNLKT